MQKSGARQRDRKEDGMLHEELTRGAPMGGDREPHRCMREVTDQQQQEGSRGVRSQGERETAGCAGGGTRSQETRKIPLTLAKL